MTCLLCRTSSASFLATVTNMGESLDTLVNRDQPASPSAAEDRVADSVSSRAGAKGLSPLLGKDEEDAEPPAKTVSLIKLVENL